MVSIFLWLLKFCYFHDHCLYTLPQFCFFKPSSHRSTQESKQFSQSPHEKVTSGSFSNMFNIAKIETYNPFLHVSIIIVSNYYNYWIVSPKNCFYVKQHHRHSFITETNVRYKHVTIMILSDLKSQNSSNSS